MPPRYAYWTIIAGGLPTAFRAAEREDLLPTFARIREKHPDAEMKWFARGRLWDSPDTARDELRARQTAARSESGSRTSGGRGRDWRPGGENRDPRQKFADAKKARNVKRRRDKFERKHGAPFAGARGFTPKVSVPFDGRGGRDSRGGEHSPKGRGPRPSGPPRDSGRQEKPGRPWHGGAAERPLARPPKGERVDRKPARARQDRPTERTAGSPPQGGRYRPKPDRPWRGGSTERQPGGMSKGTSFNRTRERRPQTDRSGKSDGARRFERKAFARGQGTEEPPAPPRPPSPSREPRPSEAPEPTPPPRPSEPVIAPPGPPERGHPGPRPRRRT